ncbi:hypothetical protein FQ087_13160 [Sporosarcina sp. ANT_H38]|uniref:hypothetical protein n=1 Tax=Sporosarcina sp. ANT_H38 TaxID=2597358 RepID=UPI0011F2B705|nr:hypothetical protein [Sporosarcina sp. ANT_H38]KAA0955553.1 hypothetical protein FQ087_13160 [Sporosarcina sp. ANT_H38]
MIKTVKGKVIAGVLAVGLVSGGGVALGATDAGANLKLWYDGQFGKASTEVTSQVTSYASSKAEGLLTEYNGLKTDATDSINAKGEFVAGVANKNIDAKSREHIDSIKEEKAHIETYLASQFGGLSNFAKSIINQAGDDALAYAKNDLTQYTGVAGNTANEKVKTDVNKVTTQAIKDLEETIKVAKEELQAQLDKKTGSTVEEIKGLIDAKIVELRKEVTNLKNKLVKDQEKIITNTAKGLQLAAEAEMDALVKGINGK